MMPLHNQELFEALIGRHDTNLPVPETCVVYFTAGWCGACKRLDLHQIVDSFPKVAWFKCDIDQNDYTAGFCGIKSIPTFLIIKDKKILGMLGESRTEKVVEWLKSFIH